MSDIFTHKEDDDVVPEDSLTIITGDGEVIVEVSNNSNRSESIGLETISKQSTNQSQKRPYGLPDFGLMIANGNGEARLDKMKTTDVSTETEATKERTNGSDVGNKEMQAINWRSIDPSIENACLRNGYEYDVGVLQSSEVETRSSGSSTTRSTSHDSPVFESEPTHSHVPEDESKSPTICGLKTEAPRSHVMIETVDDIFVLRTPATRLDTDLEPVEPNPFPVGSIIQLDVTRPEINTTARSKASQEAEVKLESSEGRLDFEVTHVYWPPTMSTVYRVRRIKHNGSDARTLLSQHDYDEAIIKIFDPRLCKERAYVRQFVDRIDIFLKWSEENEQAARRFLLSDRDQSFGPRNIYSRTRALIQRLHRVAKENCKKDNCEHRDCKIDDDEMLLCSADELASDLGEAVASEARLQLLCEHLYRVECIAYDRIKFGSNSQGTVVPKLHAKGRVKTNPERTYAPHAILLEYIDGVPLTHFMKDPEDIYKLKDDDTIYDDEIKIESGPRKGEVAQKSTDGNGNINASSSSTLPKGITKNVYSSCASKEEKRRKKTAIERSLRMLGRDLNRWMELGVANDDLCPRNMIYVDNPKPGQCHFRVIDFNTCIIAPLSTTALAHNKFLVTSAQVWTSKDSESEDLSPRIEMDGFEPCEMGDSLPPHRFLRSPTTHVWWKITYGEITNFRTWMLINFITELPFLRWRSLDHKPWNDYYGIFAGFLPPVWRYTEEEEEEDIEENKLLTSIKQVIDEF